MINFSVCTIALRNKKVEEAFQIISRTGFKYVDVFVPNKKGHLSRDMSKQERGEVVKLAKKYGLKICSLAGSIGSGFSNDNEAVRNEEIKKVKDEIDLAVDVGASVIRIGPGHGEDLANMWDKIIPCLKEVAGYAEKKDVKMGMENHPGGIACKAEQAAKVCQEVGSKYLGVIYEPGNLFGALEDYKKGFEIQKDYIVHVHLKDGYPHYFGNDGFAPQRLACTVFGKGKLDIPWVLKKLKEMRYEGFVSVEYESWHREYNLLPVEEGLKICMEYLRSIRIK